MKQLFTSIRLFLFAAIITTSAIDTKAQISDTITVKPFVYTEANPLKLLTWYGYGGKRDTTGNIWDAGITGDVRMALRIKTGAPTFIKLQNTTLSTLVLSPDGLTIYKNIFAPHVAGNYHIEIYTIGAIPYPRIITLCVSYQADLQDQTIGSATYGDYPDFIWIAQGGSANVSAGKFMANYRWDNLISLTEISRGKPDSIKTFSTGIYQGWTVDGSGLTTGSTKDTIAVLEKPTFNGTAKTLYFPTTLTGVTYKLLKTSSISGTDTTWTETQNFVGDGNAKDLTLTDGKYNLTTTFGIHTAVYPYGYFVVGVTTALDKTKEENINYRLIDNTLQFDNEVNFKFYSLQGQLLQQEQGSSFKLCRQAGIFKVTDKNGNVLTAKIILK